MPHRPSRARVVSRTGTPVQRIVLNMPAAFRFEPGQYLEVAHPDGGIPLSIASAPHRLPELHLHYQSQPGAAEAARMDQLLSDSDWLEVHGPAGDVGLPTPLAGPLLLAAGGTGAAQAWSFIDALLLAPPAAPVTLLWCVDHADDLYLRRELQTLDAPWLTQQLLVDPDRSADNRGMQWLAAHGAEFANGYTVLSGSPSFVHAACDALTATGVETDRIQSDVFSYAPRG